MKKIITLALVIAVVSAGFVVAIGTDDPLITESYLKSVFMKEVKDYIDANSGNNASFNVVTVPKNKKLIGGSGCEFILRQGTAEIIASDLGGISDVTLAVDLPEKDIVPSNHLLIIPRDDGRGFNAKTDVIVMIKGSYEIK